MLEGNDQLRKVTRTKMAAKDKAISRDNEETF